MISHTTNNFSSYYYNSIVFGVEALLGSCLNLCCIVYFIKQKLTLTRYISLCMSIVSLAVSLSKIANSIDLIFEEFGDYWMVCPVFGRIDQTLLALSTFLVVILTVTKAYCMMYPMRGITVSTVKRIINIFLICYVGLGLLPIAYGIHFQHNKAYRFCGHRKTPESPKVSYFYIGFTYIPTVIPDIPIITSSVMIYRTLQRDIATLENQRTVLVRYRISSGKTILLIVLCFLFCNIPQWIHVHLFLINKAAWTFKSGTEVPRPYCFSWYWIVWKHLPALKAICDPLIFIFRMRNFKRSLINSLFYCRN